MERSLKEMEKDIISLLQDEDKSNILYFMGQIETLNKRKIHSQNFFSDLLEIFVHLQFTEEESIEHWRKILDHSRFLSRALNRKVGLRVAMVDYFFNLNRLLTNPMLIEIHVFKETENMAMIDGMTGLFNRRYMDIALKKEFNRTSRHKKELSIIIMDLDDFKQFNDTNGHVFGDLVLKEFALFLKARAREEDIVCRYGGEEFLIILPETTSVGAVRFANRLKIDMAQLDFFKIYHLTFSGGVASYPESGKSITDLINCGDRALYKAKYSGKNRIVHSEKDRREFDRFQQSWTIRYSSPSASQIKKEIITQDVSLGGVRFETDHELDLNTKINLDLKIFDSNELPITLNGKVTWIRRIGDDKFAYGASFYNLSQHQIEFLRSNLPIRNLNNEDEEPQ